MSRRDWIDELWSDFKTSLRVVGAIALVAWVYQSSCSPAHAAPRSGSYMQQSSSGAPLLIAGRIDTAKVAALAKFDDVVLNAVPWAQGVDGSPRADVPLMLRRLNPRIRIWMYVPVDPWLPAAWKPEAWDHSGYADMHTAYAAGNGFLYDTTGAWWFSMYRMNAGDYATMWRLGDVLTRLVRLRLFDGVFLDNLSPSIAWTNGSGATLDVERAGFRSLAAMDSARMANVELLIARLHEAGGCGLLVALNGTGPKPRGLDVDFREGFPGALTPFNDARRWMRTPGVHWLRADCWDSAGCEKAIVALKSAALGNPNAILSAGPGTGWPPCATYPEVE